jgi:hypothetical protein
LPPELSRYTADILIGANDCYRDYRCILETIRKCAGIWSTADLSDSRFLLKGMPWLAPSMDASTLKIEYKKLCSNRNA